MLPLPLSELLDDFLHSYWMTHLKCDGEEIKIWRNHKYFFCGEPVVFTMPLSNIMYFDIFSKIGIRKSVEFGAPRGQWRIRLTQSNAKMLRKTCITNNARFSWSDTRIIKANLTKQHSVTQPSLWVNNDYIIYSHNCLLAPEIHNSVRVKDVAFFCKSRGVRDMKIYFGYYDQIEIDGIKPKLADALEQHCKNNDAKIGTQPFATFKPTFSFSRYLNPYNWVTTERVELTEEAIIYYSKSLFNSECAYLPYEKIRATHYKRGLFGNSLIILGEQNIITRYNYLRSNVKELKEKIDECGVRADDAKLRYTWPWLRCLGAQVVGITDEGLFVIGRDYKWNGKYGYKEYYYFPYSDIYEYYKCWWALLWRTYYIHCHICNIRNDQRNKIIDLKLRRMVFWCGLYKVLTIKVKGKLDKKWLKEYKAWCKKDYKKYGK